MPEPLKNLYNQTFFNVFTSACETVIPDFDSTLFLDQVLDESWENLELKERMRYITLMLRNQLPKDFPSAVDYLLALVPELQKHELKGESLGFLSLPDYVEVFGKNYPELAIKAFEIITPLITCEFGIRPFIINHQDFVMEQLLVWSKNENVHVRRLASEGCRPRLPWAMGLPSLKKDPFPIIPILENLKDDESEYVRRSVANNLNDISKDHPSLCIKIAKKWFGQTSNTDKLIKHACRTLLKKGNPDVMAIFGLGSSEFISVKDFQIQSPSVSLGQHLEFTFSLINKSDEIQKIRVEYAIYYLKKNGTLSKKVFMLREKDYAPHSTTQIIKRQSFKPITTRKFYQGTHQVSIIVNGIEYDQQAFTLLI